MNDTGTNVAGVQPSGNNPYLSAGVSPTPATSAFAWRGPIATMTAEGSSLHVSRLKRRNGAFEIAAQSDFPMGADLRSDPPEVVAQELRERLRTIGWRDRRWVFAVPAGWFVSHRVAMPEILPEQEMEYLWLQAEQTLPVAIGHSALAVSRFKLAEDVRGATLFALGDVRLQRLEAVFKAAKLRLLAAIPRVLDAGASEASEAFLALGTTHSVLQVSAGGGVLMLREFPGIARGDIDAAVHMLKQQVCLALGQVPAAVRQQLAEINVVTAAAKAEAVVAAWNRPVPGAANESGSQSPPAALRPLSSVDPAPVCALSGGQLTAFMARPQEQSSSRRFGRRLRYAALVCVVPIGLAMVAAVCQHMRIRELKRTAAEISQAAESVDSIRRQLTELAPWTSRTPVTLNILRAVTEAFPERGTVWLTGLRVSEDAEVQLSGQARDAGAWMAMLEELRRSPSVRDLRVSQTRSDTGASDSMMVFGITFTWHGR